VKLIIHRGAKQIGGSCIEVSTATTRLILDIGSPLEKPSPLKVSRSKRSRPSDLPDVPGLFSHGPLVNAVLLSHAHGDHSGLLEWVRPEIPIYCSIGTSKMLMAGSIFAAQTEVKRNRHRPLIAGKSQQIGDIVVTGLSVDHSAFDSMALLIEADGKRLLYSGDLRLHGRKPGMARDLFTFIANKPLDVLLMEGTNLREGSRPRGSGNLSEADLEAELRRAIERSNHLVLANFSPQHFDRMMSFYKATKASRRIFVLDVYGAFVWHLASGQCKIPRPTAVNSIRVYYNQSFKRTWQRKRLKKIHAMFLSARIDLPTVLAEPERYTILFRPSMLRLDFSGILPQHTMCLYSFWSGYLVKPEYQELRAALNRAEGEFVECHTSGHIFAGDIVTFVKAANPRHVVPVHTESANKFPELFQNTLLLPDGSPLVV
jgi:ribonuclease J